MENSMVLLNGIIYTENGIIPLGFLRVNGSKIHEIGDMNQYKADGHGTIIDLKGKIVIPGFIDLHIHGTAGCDVMDGEIEALVTMAKTLPQEGTTSFLATTITQSDEAISKSLKNVATFMKNRQLEGQAEILGVHLEGPFINPKMAGAQPAKFIVSPQIVLFKKWQEVSGGNIRQVTLAPEMDNGMELVSYLKKNNIIASIGHSFAKFCEVKEAINAGVTQVTHLFNQMRGLHHREPGVVGAAFLSEELYAEIIVDGIHVSQEMVNLAYMIKGSNKLILITDAIRAKCLKNGHYELGGQEVLVKDGRAKLANGTLAGSVLRLSDAFKNMMAYVDDIGLEELIQMTSYNPASQLNLLDRKGSIKKRKDADLVILDEAYEIVLSICRGKIAYQTQGAVRIENHPS